MALLLTVLFVALVFEYINGFHDTANSIATVVSTKVLTARAAILLATVTNLWGALTGTAVAKTISGGLVNATFVTPQTIIAALFGAIVWNLITWWLGLPSSLLARAGRRALRRHRSPRLAQSVVDASSGYRMVPHAPWWKYEGLLPKVFVPMVALADHRLRRRLFLMTLLYLLVRNWRVKIVNCVFGFLQLISSGYMGHSHGLNDAQKTMGIMALALVGATKSGALDHAPAWLSFLKLSADADPIPLWIKLSCALIMAAGTAAGGWRIIRTMGHKMVRLQPIHGFAAETVGATVLQVAGGFGMPVSTTHAITASIMGVGCAKRFSALNLPVVHRILWAWVLTVPAAGIVGYLTESLFKLIS